MSVIEHSPDEWAALRTEFERLSSVADRHVTEIGRLREELSARSEQLRGAVDALYTAHDFIGRATKWIGTDEDERDGLLAEIERHFPQGGQ